DELGQGLVVAVAGAKSPVVVHGVAHLGGHVLAVILVGTDAKLTTAITMIGNISIYLLFVCI
ncbi:MAG: hypothetical protein IIV45_15585, partial [Lachnospiraceae bacterium]|nr:hypothetical protein [Lachnospiraceae bacterium]